MDGRTAKLRKLGLGAVVVGGTLLFGIGLAGAQSSSGGGDGVVRNPASLNAHTRPSDVMIGGSAGAGGCGGDGGVTGAVVSSLEL
jgi:hypothetical protein